MSFDKRHSKARWPFRALALVLFICGVSASIISFYGLVEEHTSLFDILLFISLCVFTLAVGITMITGRAPAWLIPTSKS